ncbi:unnamed protein product [Arctogadus glacialis]
MGVKGLSSLLEDNRRISPDIHFRDSKLVVDGNNLIYHLYYSSNLDQNHGGEYLAFQAEVQAFFKTLADCGIKPYVVMEGGSSTSDIRLETLKKRAREKTLNDLKVPLVKFFKEADGRLAALVREWA